MFTCVVVKKIVFIIYNLNLSVIPIRNISDFSIGLFADVRIILKFLFDFCSSIKFLCY